MKLYTQNKSIKVLDFEKLLCIGYGNTANIYKIDDYIYKRYFSYTSDKYKLDSDVFTVLKQLKSENMITIDELLYEDENLEEINGYIAKYYLKKIIDIFDKKSDYVLENMNQIEKLFDELSKNGIRVNDVKYDNTILTENKIILIDPDAYKKVICNREKLKIYNKKELMKLFKSIYLHSKKSPYDSKELYELFNIELNEKTNVTFELSKRLTKKT